MPKDYQSPHGLYPAIVHENPAVMDSRSTIVGEVALSHALADAGSFAAFEVRYAADVPDLTIVAAHTETGSMVPTDLVAEHAESYHAAAGAEAHKPELGMPHVYVISAAEIRRRHERLKQIL